MVLRLLLIEPIPWDSLQSPALHEEIFSTNARHPLGTILTRTMSLTVCRDLPLTSGSADESKPPGAIGVQLFQKSRPESIFCSIGSDSRQSLQHQSVSQSNPMVDRAGDQSAAYSLMRRDGCYPGYCQLDGRTLTTVSRSLLNCTVCIPYVGKKVMLSDDTDPGHMQ